MGQRSCRFSGVWSSAMPFLWCTCSGTLPVFLFVSPHPQIWHLLLWCLSSHFLTGEGICPCDPLFVFFGSDSHFSTAALCRASPKHLLLQYLDCLFSIGLLQTGQLALGFFCIVPRVYYKTRHTSARISTTELHPLVFRDFRREPYCEPVGVAHLPTTCPTYPVGSQSRFSERDTEVRAGAWPSFPDTFATY